MTQTPAEIRARARRNYHANREKRLVQMAEYRKTNREILNKKKQKTRSNNPEKAKAARKKAYYNNPNKNREAAREYYHKNRAAISRRIAKKYRSNTSYRIAHVLRTRLLHALKNNQKVGSAVSDLGCTIPELRTYLEARFTAGMTWDNWTTDGWHLDHIRPLASFDLTDREQLLAACNYRNLQPMWAQENLRKGSHSPILDP